jgi:primary-amine oxidase
MNSSIRALNRVVTKHSLKSFAFRIGSSLLICLLAGAGRAYPDDDGTPLASLSKDEILTAVQILRQAARVTGDSRFSLIALHEPSKHEVLEPRPGSKPNREAFMVVYERNSNQTFEAIVDLSSRKVSSWKEIHGVQPSYLNEDTKIVEDAVRADPRWREAMRKRGISDLNRVRIDDWAGGYFGDPKESGFRFRRAISYYGGDPSANTFTTGPVEGVVVYVNLNTKKVFKFIDTGVVPRAKSTPTPSSREGDRPKETLKKLQIIQPDGTSFRVRDNEVSWQNWRFRFAMNSREGLVLYTVGYEDRGKLRSILYRGSLSEMVVPYADPSEAWYFRNAFDEGEDSVGRYANSMEPEVDAPSNATFFDATLADETGVPFVVPRTVALYEQDGGLLFKHFDRDNNSNNSRRSRELVLSWIATVGNYDYGFNWIFHQDGTLEMQVLLTGIMETKGVDGAPESHPPAADMAYGHLVEENLLAVHHQHFFNFRLDMDVDGTKNSIVEINTLTEGTKPGNRYKSAFVMKGTALRSESTAHRNVNLASSRKWEVVNPSVKNGMGACTGYILVPEENSVPYAAPDSWLRKRAGFINAHFWATAYDPAQLYAAGFYANQSHGDDGLPVWIRADRSLQDSDVVIWYTLGVTHVPRPEEWPIMAVHSAGFRLVPDGFFDHNPAVDVPSDNHNRAAMANEE